MPFLHKNALNSLEVNSDTLYEVLGLPFLRSKNGFESLNDRVRSLIFKGARKSA